MRVDWTPIMVETLKRLRGDGLPLLRCAEIIGVDYKTAVRKARLLVIAARMPCSPRRTTLAAELPDDWCPDRSI